jgi:hypothetical protein
MSERQYLNNVGPLENVAPPREYKMTGGSTDKPSMHLLTAHSINKNGPIPAEERLDRSLENQFPPVDREQFEVLLVKWVASSNQPCLEVENPDFRNLMNFLKCRVLDVLPRYHEEVGSGHLHRGEKEYCGKNTTVTFPGALDV